MSEYEILKILNQLNALSHALSREMQAVRAILDMSPWELDRLKARELQKVNALEIRSQLMEIFASYTTRGALATLVNPVARGYNSLSWSGRMKPFPMLTDDDLLELRAFGATQLKKWRAKIPVPPMQGGM